VAIPVDIIVLRSGGLATIPGRSLDLGEGGVAAVLAAELQLGESVEVEFQLPGGGRALQARAVVRHHDHLRCGLEFQGLSGDQRSMIRRWAGNTQPLAAIDPAPPGPISTPAANAVAMKMPVPLAGPTRATTARQQLAPAGNRALHRLLRLTLGLLLVSGVWAAWQWHLGWQQLEARMARKDMHAQAPAAKVPAEVMERLLLRRVDPVYPDSARRANLQGIVVLHAVIAADGTAVHLNPGSCADALAPSAMDAVRWWRCRPYRVRGEPTTVEPTLAVEFHF